MLFIQNNNKDHHQRLVNIKDEEILAGGKYNNDKIEPTLVLINDLNSQLVKEEIFQ